jgi:hypothetical protein
MAQPSLTREYEYDAAGNRTLRKVVSMQLAPPAPSDSTLTDQETEALHSLEPLNSLTQEYYVETIAQVELKIYPNPTTEKITLEITNKEQLQAGKFTLYSVTGQLLQEHTVHSATTTVSLANLPKGIYMLKVKINNRTEEWKIIKQ